MTKQLFCLSLQNVSVKGGCLHPIHAKAMNGFYAPFYKRIKRQSAIMYISKKDREKVRNMFEGKCAYSGTELLQDWQVDHVNPLVRNWWTNTVMFENNHKLENMIPSQKIINQYKHSRDLEQFRDFMQDFHVRISNLPKNPITEKSIKRKVRMLEIAKFFNITPEKPFSGKFWFETLN